MHHFRVSTRYGLYETINIESDPHTKDGLAIGTGDGRVGNEWALFRELIVEAMEERREREREPGETVRSSDKGLDTMSGGGGVEAIDELLTGDTVGFWTGARVEGTDVPEAARNATLPD